MIGALSTGKSELEQEGGIKMMVEQPTTSYGKIMLNNKIGEWERMNDPQQAFARRAEALRKRKDISSE